LTGLDAGQDKPPRRTARRLFHASRYIAPQPFTRSAPTIICGGSWKMK
jgi:hypothetical protein